MANLLVSSVSGEIQKQGEDAALTSIRTRPKLGLRTIHCGDILDYEPYTVRILWTNITKAKMKVTSTAKWTEDR